MALSLLDTDILSEFLKQQNPHVTYHAAAYLQHYGQFAFSVFTRFEIMRGFREKNARMQESRFEVFCQHSQVLPITDAIFDHATELWVFARRGGYPCADADLLIAATAISEQRVLVTGNTTHFGWMPNLIVEDWRMP